MGTLAGTCRRAATSFSLASSAVDMVLWGEISGESTSDTAVYGAFAEKESGSVTLHGSPSPALDSSSSHADSDSGSSHRAHPLANSEMWTDSKDLLIDIDLPNEM